MTDCPELGCRIRRCDVKDHVHGSGVIAILAAAFLRETGRIAEICAIAAVADGTIPIRVCALCGATATEEDIVVLAVTGASSLAWICSASY